MMPEVRLVRCSGYGALDDVESQVRKHGERLHLGSLPKYQNGASPTRAYLDFVSSAVEGKAPGVIDHAAFPI